ncbi:MAG: M24 family metallopeptidase [Thermotogae bacterium]|nr:M24 family metallopeptidase [Thermotogota bacterium]
MAWKKLTQLRSFWRDRHDAYLLYKPEAWMGSDLRYITGFSGSTGVFLQTRRRNFILVDFRYKSQVREEVREGITVLDVPPGESLIQVLGDKLRELGVKSVALEGNAPVYFLKALRKTLRGSGIRLYAVSGLIARLRVRKEAHEIERLRRAQELTDRLFEWVLNNVRPGKMTERDLALEMEVWARRNGADGMSFPPIVAVGANSAKPHARPTDTLIPTRGVLLLDFGLKVEGYVSDMTRTLWIGRRVPSLFKRAYEVVLEAQERAIRKLSFSGAVPAKEVDAAAREYIDSTEFKGTFGHGLGHGIGMDVHEAPSLNPKSEYVLKGKEVVTVEPGIYLDGEFGVRIEDVVIAGSGENITGSPKREIIKL